VLARKDFHYRSFLFKARVINPSNMQPITFHPYPRYLRAGLCLAIMKLSQVDVVRQHRPAEKQNQGKKGERLFHLAAPQKESLIRPR